MNALFDCRRSCEAMGTRFEAVLAGDDAEHLDAVAVAVLEEIVRLDGALSRFDPRSEIARINREASDHPVRVDREVFALLDRCEQARRVTEGYFDVTRESGETPALLLDAEACTVRLARPGVAIDLGGIGKGYALDRGREILLQYGVTRALLHGGTSSVLALGKPRDKGGWPVDIRHPPAPATRVELVDRAFSCSAIRHPDQTQSDVVNPLTGETLAGNAACVALSTSATEAEFFSTALLAMGREQAMRYLRQHTYTDLSVGWIDSGAGFAWIYGS